MSMTGDNIRESFLRYFEEKGHKIMPSSSLVPHGDPTLLLTSAGMVQFKPYFLGEKPPATRMTSCQKCFRVTDIDSVGDTKHLTFFEMLGNFSIGDYFKEGAIDFAWEYVIERLQLPKERIWITVFRDDDEAFEIWNKKIGVPTERIVRCGEKENFWGPAGDSGPCGPCSELHYDFGKDIGCRKADCSPACSCERFCEIWNLVFVQYNQDKSGKRTPLTKGHIDTGMGLERMTVIMQNRNSVYETDLFTPLLDAISALSGIEYGSDSAIDNNIRVVAEHGRATTFLIADGVLPGNEKQSYVLRRLMRRAIFFGEKLVAGKSFLTEIAKVTIERMKHEYPELGHKKDFILKVIQEEEARFRDTLKTGTQLLEGIMSEISEKGEKEISGEQAFKLYDTYGFPVDLTQEVASKKGFMVDMTGFEAEMEKQRERAKASQKFKKSLSLAADVEVINGCGTCVFTGYENLSDKSVISGLLCDNKNVNEITEGQEAAIMLDKTPFYAEKGGQVGDTGEIIGSGGRFIVKDTVKISDKIVAHKGYVVQGVFKTGDEVTAEVDIERRLDIARNHTATHLLQYALRNVLGEHVQQRGSLVAPDRLRFDFSHMSAMTEDEIEKVQSIVNYEIRRNHAVHPDIMPYKQAVKDGAIALFDEKYGDEVRVLKIGSPLISSELCGGTHVSATGEIGFFQIISESSIGGGIRRIEAVSGRGAEQAVKNNIINLKNEIMTVQAELDRERRQVASLQRGQTKQQADSLLGKVEIVKDIQLLVSRIEASDIDMMRDMADMLRAKLGSGIVVLGAVFEDKPSFIVAVTPDLVKKGYQAGRLVKHISSVAGGGGGGKPDMAQGGGRDIDKLEEAINSVKGIL
ncbi:MAG: alanine--tRNA ligase [Dehalococcoidales bacterium]|nr:alanine--tRNA ligase [Dehalococcoidales bacterium]